MIGSTIKFDVAEEYEREFYSPAELRQMTSDVLEQLRKAADPARQHTERDGFVASLVARFRLFACA